MKAATIIVGAEEGPTGEAAGKAQGNAADSAGTAHCQRYYMDHMPLSEVQVVADPKQYAALCKVR